MNTPTLDMLSLLTGSFALAEKASTANDRLLDGLLYLLKLHPLSPEQSAELVRILQAHTLPMPCSGLLPHSKTTES